MRRCVFQLAFTGLLLTLPGVGEAQLVSVTGSVVRGGLLLEEAAVYLVPIESGSRVPEPVQGATIDQVNLHFVPRVLVVTPGTVVRFLNSDPLPHNVFGPGGTQQAFDLGTYPAGAYESHQFVGEGVHVVLCHVHPEMAAYIIVANAVSMTTTGADGRFSMEDVQPGRYRLHTWYPGRGSSATELDLTVGDGGVEDLRIVISG